MGNIFPTIRMVLKKQKENLKIITEAASGSYGIPQAI